MLNSGRRTRSDARSFDNSTCLRQSWVSDPLERAGGRAALTETSWRIHTHKSSSNLADTPKTQYHKARPSLMLQATGPIWRFSPVRHDAEACLRATETELVHSSCTCTLSSFVRALDGFRVAVGALARKCTTVQNNLGILKVACGVRRPLHILRRMAT